MHHAALLQDATTRVWDMRMLDRSLYLLRSSVGAVRSLRFSPCGSILAAAESIDFVRLYDVDADFIRCSATCRLVSMLFVEHRVCHASCVVCFCDVTSMWRVPRSQEIDMFGEIGGIAFSPDSEALFVALSDVSGSETSYSSLVQFRKCDGVAAHLGRPGQLSACV